MAPQMTAFDIKRAPSLKPSIDGDAISHALRASVKTSNSGGGGSASVVGWR